MNKNLLILYKSKTGFTKKYADWIADETDGTAVDFREATPELLSSFSKILFGCRMHAGKIDGLVEARSLFQKNHIKLSALFVTGAMPNTEEETIAQMWHNNLSSEELNEFPHFYMQSGLCYEKMNLTDKAMMRMFSFMMKRKKNKTPDEIRFAKMIAHSYDISSRECLEPLLKYLSENFITKGYRKLSGI